MAIDVNQSDGELTLDEALAAAELASSAQRLMILQQLSNNYGTTLPSDQQAQQSWSELANEVGQETARLAGLARRNRHAVLSKPTVLERQYLSVLDSQHLDPETKHKVVAGIDAAGGVVAWVTASIDSLDRDLPAQRERFFGLSDRIAADVSGQVHKEDLIASALKQLVVCGLYGAATGAALATGNVFGVCIALAAATSYGCFG